MRGVWILLLLTEIASGTTLLRVRPHVVVTPDTEVKLSQLIDTQSLTPETQKRLEKINVSRSPGFGEQQELSKASLMELLRPVVQEERQRTAQPVHLVLPKSVVIDTLKRGITTKDVSFELLQAWQPLCPECKLELEGLSLPKIDNIRDWSLKIRAELPRGSFSIAVELIREDGSPLPAWISGRLLTQRKVPVAKRILAPGERLQTQDIEWQFRDTSFALDGIPSESELVGKQVKQGLRAEDIIWRNQIEKEKAIRRGEMVQVHSREANWEVSMSLVAQQDAFVGDMVALKNLSGGGALMGQVVGQGQVELR